jgi:hypothetical protein
MTDQELEQEIIKLWSSNGADYIDNVRRELPRIVSALKQVQPPEIHVKMADDRFLESLSATPEK